MFHKILSIILINIISCFGNPVFLYCINLLGMMCFDRNVIFDEYVPTCNSESAISGVSVIYHLADTSNNITGSKRATKPPSLAVKINL